MLVEPAQESRIQMALLKGAKGTNKGTYRRAKEDALTVVEEREVEKMFRLNAAASPYGQPTKKGRAAAGSRNSGEGVERQTVEVHEKGIR